MTVRYKKIRPKPIFEQIIDQIKDYIINGALRPGDLLPPERQLSEMIGVNRHTLREALKVLEYLGVIKGKTGIGTIINNVGQDILIDRIAIAEDFSPRQFLVELNELRQVLEPSIAAFAAKRASEDDLAAMDEIMNDFKKEIENNNIPTDADERLHVALANAAHNSTFVRLTEPIMSMQAKYREKSLKLKGRREKTYREHEAIYNAVKNRQPEKARKAMAYHLSQVEAMLHKTIRSDSD